MVRIIIVWTMFILIGSIGSFGKNAVADSNFIQVNVDNALNESFKEKSIEPLKNIERKMNSKKGNIWTYWKAYIKMCKSLYYISVNKGNNAKSMLNEAIDMLEKKANFTTEDYALIAYMQSQSIRYTKGMESGVLAAKSKNNAKLAIQKEPKNIRGWFVLAIIDYYTPKVYGGKEKCESYLLKALSLPSQKIKNAYLPSWGRKEAYLLILAYYQSVGQIAKLHSFYNKAVKEFPYDSSFKKYEK